ncbi:putative carboxypeptidase YodJ [Paenibacillus sp. CCS19]|uniref:M15 family metallopeptidase n=1 Tax=Paenibacillus sp. CCS19 TaxID=3158387 RepID=UPI00256A496F|nr:M15 family metallopeptidase [Paenibacillus cellulosilyticus]GMK39908.1 putative carboxypeptidase YodJ [Paenibacillus cellulosilyticus]
MKVRQVVVLVVAIVMMGSIAAGCGSKPNPSPEPRPAPAPAPAPGPTENALPTPGPTIPAPTKQTPTVPTRPTTPESAQGKKEQIRHFHRLSQPNNKQPSPFPFSIAVIVNKFIYLPSSYTPSDLVYPNVQFLSNEQTEKRKMRREAAKALERLFDGARKDGVHLSGVSAYRSYSTQKWLFQHYVNRDGYAAAVKYSAIPGTSEHQTGLAIDVSGEDGKCAVSSCFADTKEAKWLSKHSAEYGFIVRYPKGKESITGYKYEPWHIRYIGPAAMAKEIRDRGITLEEFLDVAPVNAK